MHLPAIKTKYMYPLPAWHTGINFISLAVQPACVKGKGNPWL